MLLPKNPCPVDGLVPWMALLCPIKSRKQHPVFGWTYVLHHYKKGHGLVIWANVSQEDIVQEMERTARWRVGDSVQLGPRGSLTVLKRKWNFEKGAFTYAFGGSRAGQLLILEEEEVIKRVEANNV